MSKIGSDIHPYGFFLEKGSYHNLEATSIAIYNQEPETLSVSDALYFCVTEFLHGLGQNKAGAIEALLHSHKKEQLS